MLSIKWRPSGGRGEYEYKATGLDVLGKRIDIKVPQLGVVIPTDAHFQIKDGKPRLRRENPNDRGLLNVPPLVAAISGLPEPRREDLGGTVSFPLSDKSYVVDEVLFEVVTSDEARVVIKPILLRPRNSSDYIDIESRVSELTSSTHPDVQALVAKVLQGTNSAALLNSAAIAAHNAFPHIGVVGVAGSVQPAPPDEVDEIVEEYVGSEGKEKIRTHRHKERDKKLIALAKKRFKLIYGKLFCECCGIDFAEMYSSLGADYIEAHHKTPLSTLTVETKTSIDDLVMLCANCHRMVHRTASCAVAEVKALVEAGQGFVNAANIALLNAEA